MKKMELAKNKLASSSHINNLLIERDRGNPVLIPMGTAKSQNLKNWIALRNLCDQAIKVMTQN